MNQKFAKNPQKLPEETEFQNPCLWLRGRRDCHNVLSQVISLRAGSCASSVSYSRVVFLLFALAQECEVFCISLLQPAIDKYFKN